MAFVPAVNVMKAAITLLWGGQRVVNVLNFLKGSTVTQADLEGLANALLTWWNTSVRPNTSSDAALQSIVTTDQSNQSAPSFTIQISPVAPGGEPGGTVSNNVAVVVSLRTGFRGRSYRGRVYVPGIRNTHLVDQNHVYDAFAVALAAQYAALSTVEAATTTTHVIVSRFANKAPRATAIMTEVTSYVTETTVDSQRRRLPLRGD